jgi:hypothetical protein
MQQQATTLLVTGIFTCLQPQVVELVCLQISAFCCMEEYRLGFQKCFLIPSSVINFDTIQEKNYMPKNDLLFPCRIMMYF